MKIYSISDRGRRSSNDDFILTKELGLDSWLLVVCDGMGSYDGAGETAKYVAESLSDQLSPCTSKIEIQNCVSRINNEISKSRELTGTTVGAAHISQDLIHIFWVGDVRISLIIDDKIKYQSEDHSLINELKKSNPYINAERIKELSSVVTRSLEGTNTEVEIKTFPHDFANKILITSDGIHSFVSQIEIATLLKEKNSQNFLRKVDEICKVKSQDNYSAIVIDL